MKKLSKIKTERFMIYEIKLSDMMYYSNEIKIWQ